MKKKGGGLVEIGKTLTKAVVEASKTTREFNQQINRIAALTRMSTMDLSALPRAGSLRLGDGQLEPWMVKSQMVNSGGTRCQYARKPSIGSPTVYCGKKAIRACQVCYTAICRDHCSYHPVAHHNIQDRAHPLGLCPSCLAKLVIAILTLDPEEDYNFFREQEAKKWMEKAQSVMVP